jgi:hypothetical protein
MVFRLWGAWTNGAVIEKVPNELVSHAERDSYRSFVLSYHSAYDSVIVSIKWLPLACIVFSPVFLIRGITETKQERNHTPPFLRRSSALAFLADNTSGASVLSGSAVLINGCTRRS